MDIEIANEQSYRAPVTDNDNEGSRLQILSQLLREKNIGNQNDLVHQLQQKGFVTTQSSISRDLKKLNVVKVDGVYRLPGIAPGESQIVDKLDAHLAGDHLVVFKTSPGSANRIAFIIDEAKVSGILGTIAGDDTIFVATATKAEQSRVVKRIFSLF
tara:strand:+ start:1245 stop:1715 length:471 start_codon:yes stop_codon:yes gene_type:complete